MPRALSEIITELNAVFNPQRDVYNQRLGVLDPELEAEEKGLEAAKRDSFQEITTGANRRGLFFSGIPLAEQGKYLGAQFLPAVANLKAKYANERFGLRDALAKITQDQYMKGQQLYQSELDREAAERASRASGGGGGFSPSFGRRGGGEGIPAAPQNFRPSYDRDLAQLEAAARSGQQLDWSALSRQFLENYGNKGISTQEINATLVNLARRYPQKGSTASGFNWQRTLLGR